MTEMPEGYVQLQDLREAAAASAVGRRKSCAHRDIFALCLAHAAQTRERTEPRLEAAKAGNRRNLQYLCRSTGCKAGI